MLRSYTPFSLLLAALAQPAAASLNCTVKNAPVPQYACPNATCPQIGEFKVGDIAWIWCAVDDMEQPKYVHLPTPSTPRSLEFLELG